MNDKLKIAIFNYSSKNNLLLENFETTTKNYNIFKRNSYNISPRGTMGTQNAYGPSNNTQPNGTTQAAQRI